VRTESVELDLAGAGRDDERLAARAGWLKTPGSADQTATSTGESGETNWLMAFCVEPSSRSSAGSDGSKPSSERMSSITNGAVTRDL
jgi:hypothetical protein